MARRRLPQVLVNIGWLGYHHVYGIAIAGGLRMSVPPGIRQYIWEIGIGVERRGKSLTFRWWND